MRDAATWYGWLVTGGYIYLLNGQGNVLPFLKQEFSLSYRDVSLHSSAIALGVLLVGLFGERVSIAFGRRNALRFGMLGLSFGGLCLCFSPAPWASVASCSMMGVLGTLGPAIVPALLSDIHGERRAAAYAGQGIVAYAFGFAVPLITGLFIWLGWGWRPAVLLGVALNLIIVAAFWRVAIADSPSRTSQAKQHLPPVFWAYWSLLFAATALEFCVVFWAPEFFAKIVHFDAAMAATAAAGFPLGMLIGRIALGGLVHRVPTRALFAAALIIVAVGFALYWGVSQQIVSIIGVFIIGLGIAPLYPLSTSFAVGAAPGASDLAAVRLAMAFGSSLLLAPFVLGSLADRLGIGTAHLALPVLIVAAGAVLAIAATLERRGAREAG
ncbi:MAG: MFS transporter [Devosia sp.]